ADRGFDRRAQLGLPGDQADEVVHLQRRRSAGQVVVLGRLDAGRAVDGVIAGNRRVKRAVGVEALVDPGMPLGQPGFRDLGVAAVSGGQDGAALVLELLVEDADVAGLGRQAGRLERLHEVDVDQQQHEHRQAGDGQAEQRFVHPARTTWVMPSSWIGCGAGRRAVSLIRISTATSAQLATSEEPPWDRNGVVIPVSGISRVTPPTITNTCRARTKASPPASSLANGSLTAIAARRPRCTSSPKMSSMAISPVRPSSSPNAVMMKSLCTSGVKNGWPWPSPVPRMPPKAIPYIPWASW